MMTDPDGRRRVELASETITKHIVGITGDIAEEEDTNKRRREEKMDDATGEILAEHLPGEVLPSGRAPMGGKDATTPANAAARKRRAEEEPDDLRSGVWANTGQDGDATIPGGATASGSGTKRPADDEADDRGRGDDVDDSGMI